MVGLKTPMFLKLKKRFPGYSSMMCYPYFPSFQLFNHCFVVAIGSFTTQINWRFLKMDLQNHSFQY